MTAILRNTVLSRFVCTGDKCPDTCCKQWSMQVDDATLDRYKYEAPSLLEAVEPDTDGSMIMRKSKETGYCVKLDGGLCGVYKEFGKKFLGDACNFYPRVTRALGELTVMTATLSCPEIARLAMEDTPWTFETAELDRLPSLVKDYLPGELSSEAALAVHNAFLAVCDEDVSVELAFARIAGGGRALERIDKAQWPAAAGFYLRTADARLPAVEMNPADPFNILHALCGLIVAAHKPVSPALSSIINNMEEALHATLDWKNISIRADENSVRAYQKLAHKWNEEHAKTYAPILRRWLKMQIALALFPFAGLGETLSERITIIGVRLATLKLALMSGYDKLGGLSALDGAVHAAQSLSRVLDHLGSSRFSLDIYAEPQWLREARMLGLIGFTAA